MSHIVTVSSPSTTTTTTPPNATRQLLLQWESLDSVNASLPSTRIKYTCLDVSTNLLVFGANTGKLRIESLSIA